MFPFQGLVSAQNVLEEHKALQGHFNYMLITLKVTLLILNTYIITKAFT